MEKVSKVPVRPSSDVTPGSASGPCRRGRRSSCHIGDTDAGIWTPQSALITDSVFVGPCLLGEQPPDDKTLAEKLDFSRLRGSQEPWAGTSRLRLPLGSNLHRQSCSREASLQVPVVWEGAPEPVGFTAHWPARGAVD